MTPHRAKSANILLRPSNWSAPKWIWTIPLKISLFFSTDLYFTRLKGFFSIPQQPTKYFFTNFIYLCSDFPTKCFLKISLLNDWWSWSYYKNSEHTICSVEKKKREEQFSETVHCYSPTPPIGWRRPKNSRQEHHIKIWNHNVNGREKKIIDYYI